MAKYFDEDKWTEAIHYKDWYLRLANDYKELAKKAQESSKEISEEIKKEIYQFFEGHLGNGTVEIGKEGPNWDEERKPIDTIVIHHTKSSPGITWQKLSAIHLIRLYATYYAAPYYEKEKHIKGQPIYSNHFRGQQQIFYAYHWLVRDDGSVERLLEDHQIGWHAGNWNDNCRSIGICLDGNFEDSSPSNDLLIALNKLIKEKYPDIQAENIKGHREINSKTTCPGNRFLKGWKREIAINA